MPVSIGRTDFPAAGRCHLCRILVSSTALIPMDTALNDRNAIAEEKLETGTKRAQSSTMDLLQGTTDLKRYIDLLSVRQNLVASNIANADTPGYKARDIDFASEFRSALGDNPPTIREVQNLPIKNDGNNVNLDRESRMLAENALRFRMATVLLKSEIDEMRKAIQAG